MNNNQENFTNNGVGNGTNGVNPNQPVVNTPTLVVNGAPYTPEVSTVSAVNETPVQSQPVLNQPVQGAVSTQAVQQPVMMQQQPTIQSQPVMSGMPQPALQQQPQMPQTSLPSGNPGVYPQTGVSPMMGQTVPNPGVMPQPIQSGVSQNPGEVPKQEVVYTPPSKIKMFFMIFFFLIIVAFVFFLPEVTEYINRYKEGKNEEIVVEKVSGQLVCSLNTNDEKFDQEYTLEFDYTDNLLEKTRVTLVTKGDASLDSAELDALNLSCQELKNDAIRLIGISVGCSYTSGQLVQTQTYDLAKVVMDDATPFFAEAGGFYSEYTYQYSINQIEKDMTSAGYSCHKD